MMTAAAAMTMLTAGCNDDPIAPDNTDPEPVPDWVEVETYAGGELGTTFNVSASAFEDPTPAVENAGLVQDFKHGEMIFEHNFGPTSEPFDGLGPLYLRTSCLMCHPGYGHGKRTDSYRYDEMGNGYLLVLYDKQTGAYLTSLTGMPQTRAIAPFKAPLDEEKIRINWLDYTDEWGNKFPDGETYGLIYPEVTIPADAYYVPVQASRNGQTVDLTTDEVGIRLESTIGIYGSGLLDAIPDEALKAQYADSEAYFREQGLDPTEYVNPAFFKDGEWVKQYSNTVQGNGEQHPFRFTYALSRGALQDGPGANAIWNITNVTRSDRRYHYMTAAYANTASQDPDVQAGFYHFINEKVGGETLRRVSHLVDQGISPYIVYDEMHDGRNLSYFKMVASLIDRVNSAYDGRLLYTYQKASDEVEGKPADDIYAQLLQVKGVKVVLFFKEKDGYVEIGMRSKNLSGIDIGSFAASLGGGGHKYAAGAKSDGKLDEVIKTTISKLERIITAKD